MGVLRSLFTGRPDAVLDAAIGMAADQGRGFSIDAATVEQAAVVTGVVSVPLDAFGTTASPAVPMAGRVSRREAMQVPAFRRATDLVSTLGGLPLSTIRPDFTVEPASWLRQPERDVPRVVTMSRLVIDLAHEGIAWWRITEFDYRGFPAYVQRLDPRSVDVLPDERVKVTTRGNRGTAVEWPDDAELIRFDMPGNGWLADGGRAIRQCLLLDAAAQRYADGTPPGDFFTPAGDVDPFDDADPDDPDDDGGVADFLGDWEAARRRRSTAYVPAAVKYNANPFNPEQLELAAQRDHAVLEISRLTGIDAEDLGVSTTSRTYSNQFDRRKAFTDFTLGLYRAVIEGRLSMRDVTPGASEVAFDLDAFLRSDPTTRYEAYGAGLAGGALDKSEIRTAERKPALAVDPTTPASPDLRIVPTPTQEKTS